MPNLVGEPAPGFFVDLGHTAVTAGQTTNMIASSQLLPGQTSPSWVFKNDVLQVKAGDKVNLSIANCTPAEHDFVSTSLTGNDKVIISVGQTASVSFNAPAKAGTYFFWCNTISQPGQPSHAQRGMVGEVVVS
ncbi:MAG TPA: plastocyanin/azurin family copper-binding protein [Chloroflexota bacterium]|nr:plastocyanin/azurin family copper-binding protein [Chloroflexota bacterium]